MSATILEFHQARKIPFHRLPFVAKSQANTATPFWNLPTMGGYAGGYQTGEAMAYAYLKCLCEDGVDGHGLLSTIVESMLIRHELEGGNAMADSTPIDSMSENYASFRGQYVGFLNTLNVWLSHSAKYLGEGLGLNNITESEILSNANNGLILDEQEYIKNLLKHYKAKKSKQAL